MDLDRARSAECEASVGGLVAAGSTGALIAIIFTALLVTWIGIDPKDPHLNYVYFIAMVAGYVLGLIVGLLRQDR
jgi:hypothetical protein